MKQSSILNPKALALGALEYALYGLIIGLIMGFILTPLIGGELVYDEHMHATVKPALSDLFIVPLSGVWYALLGGACGLVKTVLSRRKIRKEALGLWKQKNFSKALDLWGVLEKG